ncbi:Mitochondrial Carrier (MC) Family [Thraustotheca clavata]|uniref:Mitochondrial Carrier (MC) Family n=1 Tax=Thraustotheca clavata TaxID=74557 RepID=A0A1V9YN39_9STRA|nr:Mitochondrial Carrier (MC) Family [Thraustotheca clavata]
MGIIVGQPFDTIKVRLQTHGKYYKGPWDCTRHTWQHEGFRGFFKGLASPLFGSLWTSAIVFGTYGSALRCIEKDVAQPKLNSVFTAGSIAGLFQSIVLCPTDLIKCQLQVQDGYTKSRVYSGPIECAQHIYKNNGIRGLFLGFWPTIIRDSYSFGAYFYVYEAFKRSLQAKKVDDTTSMLIAGGAAGVISWGLVYPIDVIKSCIQTLPRDATAIEKTMKYQTLQLYRERGYKPFVNGLGTTLLRAFPVNAVTICTKSVMTCIIVGIATIDIVNTIASFPQEDSKSRILHSRKSRGGNGTNTLVVCAQLGAWSLLKWIGSLVDPTFNSDAKFVCDDLTAYGIDLSLCEIHPHGSLPTSYIMSSQESGSRTIFHHRNLPEVSVEHFKHEFQSEKNISWVHFECREALNQFSMIKFVHEAQNNTFISLEVEASRHAWSEVQSLLPFTFCVFFAKSYVLGLKMTSANDFFQYLLSMPQIANSCLQYIIIPWGAEGAYYLSLETQSIHHVSTISIDKPVDTVGAGDTFVAATISALYKSKPIHDAVVFGCQVAYAKCLHNGFCFDQEELEEFQSALKN